MGEHVKGERKSMIEACRRLDQLGFVPATDGNLSVRLDHRRILITPSMVSKSCLKEGQLLICDMEGRVVAGKRSPSSEMKMHLFAYQRRPEVRAVVHAHPPTATAFAAAGKALDNPVLPEVMLTVGMIPLARYATPSTTEVPRSLEPLIMEHNSILLANHGVLALGRSLSEALHRMERTEHFARVMAAAQALGGPAILNKGQIKKLLDTFGDF
jgi:L-fuculose-phosphate aldolase